MGICMCIHRKGKNGIGVDGNQYFTSSVPVNNNILKYHEHPISDIDTNGSMAGMLPISNHQLSMYNFNTNNAVSVVRPHNDMQMTCLGNPKSINPGMLEMTANNSLGVQGRPLIRVRALYPYREQNPGDLSFEKGDIMYVESDMTESWWLATHPKRGLTGYIPSNYVRPNDGHPTSLDAWYDIGRREADRMLLLAGNSRGTYIIRPCSETQSYALSVRHYDGDKNMWVVKHYKIRILDNNAGYFIANRTQFSNIQDLINHYSVVPDGLCCFLTNPCPRNYRPPVQFRDLELNRESIQFCHRLGQGTFGEVYLAKWNGTVEVAVKMRLNHTDRARFIEEARLMHAFHHPRIVQLLGVCTVPEDQPVYIIVELMKNGALGDFLRKPQGRSLTLNDLIDMMAQIASGMSYLEKKNSVHRDLRAANILVDEDNSVKVADFGLAKIISEDSQADPSTKFPIKWTAPEAAVQHIFSIKSDVWSFGVLMFEIVTYGGTPYPGMSARQTLAEVESGYRMPSPHSSEHPCPDDLYNVMSKCWDSRAENRPTFHSLYDIFNNWSAHTEAQYLDN